MDIPLVIDFGAHSFILLTAKGDISHTDKVPEECFIVGQWQIHHLKSPRLEPWTDIRWCLQTKHKQFLGPVDVDFKHVWDKIVKDVNLRKLLGMSNAQYTYCLKTWCTRIDTKDAERVLAYLMNTHQYEAADAMVARHFK